MKTIEQLKSEIYTQVSQSGFLKSVQSQVKAHVLQLIDKETKNNKQKLGFQYEHPVLKKLRNYPLTSLCMDLIQEFLESFKFKHTLNVFKKQINRDLIINRQNLSKQFTIDLSGKDQSVLLSIVGQIVNGDIKIVQKPKQQNTAFNGTRKNNFMNQDLYKNESKHNQNKQQIKKKGQSNYSESARRQQERKAPQKDHTKKYEIPDPKKNNQKLKQQLKRQQQLRKKLEEEKEKQRQRQRQLQLQKQKQKQQQERRQKQLEKQKQKQAEKGKSKKSKKQQQKPPQGASDLLQDVLGKFDIKESNKKSADQQFKMRKAYSQEKQQKKLVPQLSGRNVINVVSAGKYTGGSLSGSGGIKGAGALGGFMKYTTLNTQQQKNEPIDDETDQLQQSKDSTRKNPLYSSSESGFDKSYGYDQSVDQMAIQDYEYIQKAKKFGKKY